MDTGACGTQLIQDRVVYKADVGSQRTLKLSLVSLSQPWGKVIADREIQARWVAKAMLQLQNANLPRGLVAPTLTQMATHGATEAERVKQMELNRLKAKARFMEREQARLATDHSNSNCKRPLQVTPADATSPTAPASRTFASISSTPLGSSTALQQALRQGVATRTQPADTGSSKASPARDSRGREIRTSEFVDYDLSTLKNSKGGFLVLEEEDDPRIARQRRLEEERKAQRLREAERLGLMQDPHLDPDRTKNAQCQQCGTVELDFLILKVFGVPVCHKCKTEHPDKYSLLTKTECKEDYLLTDPELKDEDLLPHLLKANPHRSTYSNMMLFLRCQVEEFAFSDKKWGSPEALDAEFERRQAMKKNAKNKKFQAKLDDLRRRTKSNLHVKRQEQAHQHTFELVQTEDGERDRCTGCGFEVEVETF